MSTKYPGQCVATRRGSPLLIGIKTKQKLNSDYVPILYRDNELRGELSHYRIASAA